MPRESGCANGRDGTPISVRSFASVQYSNPLLSCACALFVKNTREGVHPDEPNCQGLRTASSRWVARWDRFEPISLAGRPTYIRKGLPVKKSRRPRDGTSLDARPISLTLPERAA